MHRFFLIRHGQSQANAGLATIAPKDVELTSEGYEQARKIAVFLREYTALNLIVTSRYLRTKQTAYQTRCEFRLIPHKEWKVEEFTYLSPEYFGNSTIYERRPLVDAYWDQHEPSFKDGYGSESFNDFMGRVQGVTRKLKKAASKGETIAVFSHEQFISAVLWSLNDEPARDDPEAMRAFRNYFNSHRIPNGSIVEV